MSDYDNFVCVQRPRSSHWHPIFQLLFASEKSLFLPSEVLFCCSPSPQIAAEWDTHPGTVFFDLFQKFEIKCKFNVYRFPFDTQVCEFVFSPYLYDESVMRLVDFKVDPMAAFKQDNEWEVEHIEKIFATRVVLLASRPQNKSVMEFRVHMRRRALSYIGTIFLPTTALAILTPMIFVIPVESGEKIGFGVSLLLAFSVFQLMLVDNLPKSDSMPLVGKSLPCTECPVSHHV